MCLVNYNEMICAFSPDRTDNPLAVGILPWRSECCFHSGYPTGIDSFDELTSIDCVIVSKQVFWSRVPKERLDNLLPSPKGGWRGHDIEMDNQLLHQQDNFKTELLPTFE